MSPWRGTEVLLGTGLQAWLTYSQPEGCVPTCSQPRTVPAAIAGCPREGMNNTTRLTQLCPKESFKLNVFQFPSSGLDKFRKGRKILQDDYGKLF